MPSRSRFALAWCLALCWAWSSAWAADADLERMAKEPLTEEQWREVSARRGSDPAFMARAYRLGCVQRLERGELAPTPANLESVRLGLTLAQQLASKSDVAGLLLCRGRLNQGGDQSKKAEADFSLALQEAAAANESGLQALAFEHVDLHLVGVGGRAAGGLAHGLAARLQGLDEGAADSAAGADDEVLVVHGGIRCGGVSRAPA